VLIGHQPLGVWPWVGNKQHISLGCADWTSNRSPQNIHSCMMQLIAGPMLELRNMPLCTTQQGKCPSQHTCKCAVFSPCTHKCAHLTTYTQASTTRKCAITTQQPHLVTHASISPHTKASHHTCKHLTKCAHAQLSAGPCYLSKSLVVVGWCPSCTCCVWI
jgi:hypothetical protein